MSAKATDEKPVKATTKAPAKADSKSTAAKATAKTTAKAEPKATAAKAAPKATKATKALKADVRAEPMPGAGQEAPMAAAVAAEPVAAEAQAVDMPAAEAQAPGPKAAQPKRPAPKAVEGVLAKSGGPIHGLHMRYRDEVAPALLKEFGYANTMEVPRLSKIVVNIGLGEVLTNAKALDAAVGDLTLITGQKPIVTRARKSIAQFKIRTGNTIGAKVTLRGQHMWDFLERLTRLALPRIRDFRGVPGKSFDGRGNYSLGLREQLAFPEIDYDKIDRLRGLEVSIVTTARTDEESKRLLQLLGMPFAS